MQHLVGKLHLNDAVRLFDTSILQQLKQEIGGLQTLLRNHHQIFQGMVSVIRKYSIYGMCSKCFTLLPVLWVPGLGLQTSIANTLVYCQIRSMFEASLLVFLTYQNFWTWLFHQKKNATRSPNAFFSRESSIFFSFSIEQQKLCLVLITWFHKWIYSIPASLYHDNKI